jgi:hypothetical protein
MVHKFIYYHPLAYRRMLLGVCAVMLLSGMASLKLAPIAAVQQRLDVYKIGSLSVPAIQSGQPQLAMVQLPGSDGSASAAEAATSPTPSAPLAVAGDVRGLGEALNAIVFGDANWPALNALWTRESNWNPDARNRWSGACGIPQALPCSKITDMSPQGQISWGLQYIQRRYGNPQAALAHEDRFGWY